MFDFDVVLEQRPAERGAGRHGELGAGWTECVVG
jgi:hypothetical protein